MKREHPRRFRDLLCLSWQVAQQKGIKHLIRAAATIIMYRVRSRIIMSGNSIVFAVYAALKHMFCKTFTFRGDTYRYFYHRYNTTWRNERSVEIPIIYRFVKERDEVTVLEVGNVLSHYFPVRHDIVDKHEHSPRVINQDIVDFHPQKKYDLIVSISTLEHVGWDELYAGWDKGARDPTKALRAIENLKELLAPKGIMVVTFPIGYNPYLDRLLRDGKIPLTALFCLKRISKDNEWKEVSWSDVLDARFGSPFPNANGLIIGIFRK